MKLGISNGTALTVTLFVSIDPSRLPALPWKVEARSASGRILTTMHVEVGEIQATIQPDGAIERTGAMGRVDLSCGRLTIWAGDFYPSGPPPTASAGIPGDCLP